MLGAKNMSKILFDINSPFVIPWIEKIGKVILNFSAIEFESYLWLVQMTEQPELIPEFTEKYNLSNRIQKIIKLIKEKHFAKDWESDSIILWNELLELSNLRNRIAHNPIMFGQHEENGNGEPDFIGIINMKKNKVTEDEPLLSKKEMDAFINRIVIINKHLYSLREQWCEIRDSNK